MPPNNAFRKRITSVYQVHSDEQESKHPLKSWLFSQIDCDWFEFEMTIQERRQLTALTSQIAGTALPFKPSRCIKTSFYTPESRLYLPTTKWMKISIKLVYQYMVIFFNFSPTSNHLHPLQVENCDSDSRVVVDEDDNGKIRLERVNGQIRFAFTGQEIPRYENYRMWSTFIIITSFFLKYKTLVWRWGDRNGEITKIMLKNEQMCERQWLGVCVIMSLHTLWDVAKKIHVCPTIFKWHSTLSIPGNGYM